MSVSLALNNALTGLNVNQQALTVLSQNIANANTPGYSKQTINQNAVSIGGVGQGVSIDSITRKVDEYLTRAAQNQTSEVGKASSLNDYYSKIQLLLGSPGNKNSVDAYLNNFFNSLQSLSQTPNNTTLQQTVVNSGVTVSNQINQLASGLNELQFQADQDITLAIQTINTNLTNVFSLNKVIAQSIALGKSVADLQDQRDNLVKEISQYINVNTFNKSDGSVFLTTSNGVSILDDTRYQLSYSPATSAESFANNSSLSPILLSPVDATGTVIGTNVNLTTEGPPKQITTVLTTGELSTLIEMRDKLIPNISDQLDSIAATVRDQFNAVHNAGSGYPGANSLTGTRAVNASDYNEWLGKVRFSLLDSNGQPVDSPYADENYGTQPFVLDLAKLDTGGGAGSPTVQGIINAINNNYGVPKNKAQVGNLNNIQIVSNSFSLPNTAANFTFDFNLNNISSSSANFYVTGVTVTDNLGANMPATSGVPTLNLDPAATYTTVAGSSLVTISTLTNHNLTDGQIVFLTTPPAGPDAGGTYDGIPPASLGGYFKISNASANTFQIDAVTTATVGGPYGVASQTAKPPYATATAGGDTRTKDKGLLSADFTTNPGAPYFTITATVGVDDGTGNIVTSQISYRLNNNQPASGGIILGAQTVTSPGELEIPTNLTPQVVARLVDDTGKELPKVNGQYVVTQNGYLQIQAGNSQNFLAIDTLDSKELGKPNGSPSVAGSGRGFSHYFDLNNFFTSNKPVNTGDSVEGSANKLVVEKRIQDNNGLLSLGKLSIGKNSATVGSLPNYTYQLNPGDNSTITKLAAIGSKAIVFPAAGALGTTTQTISGYIGQVIGEIATNASNAETTSLNSQALLNSYEQQSSAVSGVNLDTELANTVIYQNAYAASARVITVTNQLFETLLQTFN